MSTLIEHAVLSASGAHKWLNCPPSARLEAAMPDAGSEYAAEGRLAHAIAELKLRKAFMKMKPAQYKAAMTALRRDAFYQEEMQEYTDMYRDFVQGLARSMKHAPYVAVEKRLDYSVWVPGGFGTGDCILLCGETLHVVDFKYGRGVPVSACDNPQMMLYALGAYEAYKLLYPICFVRLSVVQPRLNSQSDWELPLAKAQVRINIAP